MIGIDDRRRALLIGVASAICARGISFATLFLIGRIVPAALGTERFGMWMVISSFAALASFADLGVGLGLINPLTEAEAVKDRHRCRSLVTNALAATSVLAVALGTVVLTIYQYVNWPNLLNASSPQAVEEVAPSILTFCLLYLAGLPFGLGSSIWAAQQRTHIGAACEAIGTALSALGVFWVTIEGFGVPYLVAVTNGGALFGAITSTIAALLKSRYLIPTRSSFSGKEMIWMFRSGGAFLALQIGVTAFTSVDGLVLSSTVGNAQAGEFSILFRMFSVVGVIIGLVMLPFWPAFAKARVNGDMAWVRSVLTRLFTAGLIVVGMLSLALVLAGPAFIPWWTAGAYHPSCRVLIALAAWTALWSLGNITGSFLNAMGAMRFQLLMVSVLVPTALIAKFLAASRFGTVGLLWATVLTYLVIVFVPSLFTIRRLLQES